MGVFKCTLPLLILIMFPTNKYKRNAEAFQNLVNCFVTLTYYSEVAPN